MIRPAVIVTAFVCAVVPAFAQTARERAAAADKRWAEYQEMMDASSPIVRFEGFSAALADENLGIRNNALWAYLHTRDRLPIEIVSELGSRVGPGDTPTVELSRIKWNEEQRALTASTQSFGVGRGVEGQVVAGRLRLHYDYVRMPSFVGQSAAPSGKPEMVDRPCDTVLSPNEARDALEGKLRCDGMAQSLLLRVPLG